MEKKSFFARHKGLTIFVVVISILAVLIVVLVNRGRAALVAAQEAAQETVTLSKMDIEKTVAATGLVSSKTTREVTTSSSSKIDEIYVELGDFVEEDEALCVHTSGTKVRSPIDGTVTAIYAVEGEYATGVLFVVEDLTQLEIKVLVPQYDIVELKKDMTATITSDAIIDGEWTGTVTSVSPVAVDEASNFAVTISIDSDLGQLTAGMSAKINFIVDQRQDVFAVPYDAVVKNDAGQWVVYAVEETETDGKTTTETREIVVEMGLDTDYYVEISSGELREGMVLLADPAGRNVSSGGSMFMFGGQ